MYVLASGPLYTKRNQGLVGKYARRLPWLLVVSGTLSLVLAVSKWVNVPVGVAF